MQLIHTKRTLYTRNEEIEKVQIKPTNVPFADNSTTTPHLISLKYIGTFQYHSSPWMLKIYRTQVTIILWGRFSKTVSDPYLMRNVSKFSYMNHRHSKGPFQYYVIKKVGGWGQMLTKNGQKDAYVIFEWSLNSWITNTSDHSKELWRLLPLVM